MSWNKKATPEALVKAGVTQYLRIKGWKVYPMMQGPLSHRGLSDFFAVRAGRIIFIECKAPKGRQSDHQKKFQDEIEAEGMTYLLVTSFNDLIAQGF